MKQVTKGKTLFDKQNKWSPWHSQRQTAERRPSGAARVGVWGSLPETAPGDWLYNNGNTALTAELLDRHLAWQWRCCGGPTSHIHMPEFEPLLRSHSSLLLTSRLGGSRRGLRRLGSGYLCGTLRCGSSSQIQPGPAFQEQADEWEILISVKVHTF